MNTFIQITLLKNYIMQQEQKLFRTHTSMWEEAWTEFYNNEQDGEYETQPESI